MKKLHIRYVSLAYAQDDNEPIEVYREKFTLGRFSINNHKKIPAKRNKCK